MIMPDCARLQKVVSIGKNDKKNEFQITGIKVAEIIRRLNSNQDATNCLFLDPQTS